MPNDSYTQSALADSGTFRNRLKTNLASIAWQVLNEDPATPNHAARAAFARQVLTGVDSWAAQIANWIVERGNVLAFATSYDFQSRSVVTASGDADIQSQLMTDWNILAGV